MLFHDRKLKAGTAAAVAASVLWMTSGGNAWAELQCARRDPASALLRLSDDPRLALSREAKASLRQAARRMERRSQPQPRPMPIPMLAAGRDVEMEAAAEMGEIAAELEALARSGAQDTERVRQSARRLERVHQQVLRKAGAIKARLHPAKLQRHDAAQARYREEMQAVFEDLETAADSGAESAVAAAAARLRRSTRERPNLESGLDPAKLPFRRAEPVQRRPGGGQALEAERAGSLRRAVASLTPPAPADLAETEDAQITPEIRALAASLENQPPRIYDWVRNNIDFYPTYGSVQGSQMTLEARRGNAFDTASLLVALLRAANVPARYVTGTIQVPVAPVLNWVGGAETPNVAQQILGQGGIPNAAFLDGGTVTHIRLDHLWVEAFADNVPSRGAVQRQGDTWVPLDPSFKQYRYTPKSDLFAANPISAILDPAGLMDVDDSLGRVTNVNREVLDQRLTDWVLQNDAYINANGVERSREGLLGRKTIVQQASRVLPASLPYEVLQRGSAVSALPAAVRHTVTLNGYASHLARARSQEAFSVTLSLAALNSRRLGIQFDPATQADADVLAAARSSGASSLPVYLVDVVPVVRLDGQTLAEGGAVQMGGSFLVDILFAGPDGPTTVPYEIVAGDEIVVGITGNGFTPEVVEKRFNTNPVDGPPEYLHQVHLHYWMETDYLAEVAAGGTGVHPLRLPSVGLFSSPLNVSYLFGAPASAVYQGSNMDVKHSLMGAAGEDPAQVVNYMKQAGFQGSYLEGAVFDQLATVDDPAPQTRGISAIHLISAAMTQGIPVYRITSANAAAVLPMLQLSGAVESDIGLAVSQGKTVLTPERDLDLGPWSGVGYIIHDESTGAGAYLISGGLNGGGILDCLLRLLPTWEQVSQFIFFLIVLALIVVVILAALGTAPAWAPATAVVVLFLVMVGGLAASSPAPSTA